MNINTGKIKYIVAREGLIIISILICIALSLYIDSRKTDKINNYVKDAKEVTLTKRQYAGLPVDAEILPQSQPKPRQETKSQMSGPWEDYQKADLKEEWEKATPIDYDPSLEPMAQFPKSTSLEVMDRTMNRDYPSSVPGARITWDKAQNIDVNARYDSKGNKLFTKFPWNIDFKNQIAFFLFCSYPAYLLIRFIVWSILTVKKSRTSTNQA